MFRSQKQVITPVAPVAIHSMAGLSRDCPMPIVAIPKPQFGKMNEYQLKSNDISRTWASDAASAMVKKNDAYAQKKMATNTPIVWTIATEP